MGETATGAVERTVDPGGIVDTDILVDVLREVPAAIIFLRDTESYGTATSITQMKLIQGSRAELRRVEQFLRCNSQSSQFFTPYPMHHQSRPGNNPPFCN